MRNPVLNILIPYLVFILIFENQIFEIDIVVNLFVIYTFVKIIIYSFNFCEKNKLYFLIIVEILIFFNLFEHYNFTILKGLNYFPAREITLNIKIKKKFRNLDNKYYITKINNSPIIRNYLLNKYILCDFENKEYLEIAEKNLQVKGIISSIIVNNQYLTTLRRCKILNEYKAKETGTLNQLDLLIEKTLLNSARNEKQLNAFLNAILLGNKKMLSTSQKSTFQNSGTLHLFAVSGLHIGFIYLIIKFLISLITFNRYISEVIIAIILFIYLDIVNYPPSALRACIMINIWQLSVVFCKRKNTLSTLSISCLLILIVNPYSLMEIGFQLSYTVVTSIIVFNIQAKKFNDKHKCTIINFFISSLFTSYSAFCGSALLIYDNFNIIVPISIIINILAIPITFIFIISIFLMLSLSIFIETQVFYYIFLYLYKTLDYLLNIFAFSDITYFNIKERNELDNSIHFFYVISILLFSNLITKSSTKIVIQICFPLILFLLYKLIGI